MEVYEEVPSAIKFTGSVLHRVARVALSLSLSLVLVLVLLLSLSLSPSPFARAGYGGVEAREARRIQ